MNENTIETCLAVYETCLETEGEYVKGVGWWWRGLFLGELKCVAMLNIGKLKEGAAYRRLDQYLSQNPSKFGIMHEVLGVSSQRFQAFLRNTGGDLELACKIESYFPTFPHNIN